jgi:hypothetical protein
LGIPFAFWRGRRMHLSGIFAGRELEMEG